MRREWEVEAGEDDWEREQSRDEELEAAVRWLRGERVDLEEETEMTADARRVLKEAKDGQLLWEEREGQRVLVKRSSVQNVVVVPKVLRKQMFERAHVGGHGGVAKTVRELKKKAFWPHMEADVRGWVDQCAFCINKYRQPRLKGVPFHNRSVKNIDEILFSDLMGPLHPADRSGHRYILTAMDGFSRFAVAVPLKDKTAKTVSQALMSHWFAPFGRPQILYSDLGTEFTAKITRDLCQGLRIETRYSLPDHHQSNSVERLHKTIAGSLRTKMAEGADLEDWTEVLPIVIAYYNATIHSGTGQTPQNIFLGRETRLLADHGIPPPPVAEVSPGEAARWRDDLLNRYIQAAREEQDVRMKYREKEYSDNPNLFPVGSLVLFFDGRSRSKLHPPWVGPYIILEHVKRTKDGRPVQYRLRCRQSGKEMCAQGGRLWPITAEEAAKYNNFRSGADVESCRGSSVTVASHKPRRGDEPADEFWQGDQGQGRNHPGNPPFRPLEDHLLREEFPVGGGGGGGGGGGWKEMPVPADIAQTRVRERETELKVRRTEKSVGRDSWTVRQGEQEKGSGRKSGQMTEERDRER